METVLETPAPRPNRRALAKASTRQKALDSAQRLFAAEGGYAAATIRTIADDMGMSTGAVFANFKDKADLYQTIYGHQPVTPEAGHALFLATRQMVADLTAALGAREAVERFPAVKDIIASLAQIKGGDR
ncbi:TetR/AcrR family transcriptional regulator [Brevundimonas sp.]|uniref:TetR/AcrR family transcriptional regulator n=1 Tax=Brevundimonas sp. TaxID=1871086 RepID=UPI003D6CCCFC